MFPVAVGSRSRLRRAYLESVQARAAHAERTREGEARLRGTEERMRIARELHDAVAHHMAVANAQAGTAAHLARTHPEQAQKILGELAGTTSSALLELRATVGILRGTDDPDLLDAFIVRMAIVPAVLALLGDRAWWLPRWLGRVLPTVDVEGEGLSRRAGEAPAQEPVGV
ncbi:histidine kinase [Streptomyces roseirectus]|uniref:histidine kinase n=1 Tax=Streptomyces roseirectus TaxID=2768066 RepID=UPI0031B631AD